MEQMLLISIKTKYSNQIFNGTKIYEYRRKSIGEKNKSKKIYVYSSEQEKAIVGYIIVDKILSGNLEYILNTTNNRDEDIIKYFDGCNICYALKIKNAVKFKDPVLLNEIKKHDNNFAVPQFYRYIKESEYLYKELLERNLWK